MWYVIQTLGGQEEKTAEMIRKMISSYYIDECFIPKRERMKKFHGSWNKTEEILFQGYVFVVSERPKELYEKLKQIPRLTKILGQEKEYFFSLDKEDKELIQKLGDQEHKTGLSRVVVEEGTGVRVIDGPLKGHTGDVVKVNLHKREVVINVKFMGREMELFMGIEMVQAKEVTILK